MCKLLNEWAPSEAAIELIKLNGIDDAQIGKSLAYLKSQGDLSDIDDVEGYDNWNAFFIMFCVKVSTNKSE
ncbi:MAG: hypothetical protein IMF15_03185 [Proteobacteria bacterium]|nr:hypothetical protein [Pseudomonadota bacterium]